jgi:hypothetical protein
MLLRLKLILWQRWMMGGCFGKSSEGAVGPRAFCLDPHGPSSWTKLTDSMDAKFGFDDNADFRQKDIFKLRDTTQEDPQEVEAAEVCLSSVSPLFPARSLEHKGMEILTSSTALTSSS